MNFPFSKEIAIRWNDLDAFRHVNNAVYITYFEEGRVAFFDALKWDWERDGLIVARNEIDYRFPLYFQDKPVLHLGCTEVGEKKFMIEYALINQNGVLCAQGKTLCVVYDYATEKTKPLSPEGIAMIKTMMVV